jgi:hypothetical protein
MRPIVPGRPFIPGGRCSQGGVKVPTGGKGGDAQARERLSLLIGRKRVSRFGATPKPTVTVRMKENGLRRFARLCRVGSDVPYALILVLKEENHESDRA